MYSGSEPQTSQPAKPVQGARSAASRQGLARQGYARAAGRLALTAALAALSGCGSVPASINPVTWWHDLQGGAIAEQRPPPPGATDPYPNLASVPERPAPLNPAMRQKIHQGLVADRANAQHEAATVPIPDPSSRTAAPGLFGGNPSSAPPAPASAPSGPAPAPASSGSIAGPSATLAAASAPPASAPAPAAPGAAEAAAGVPLGQMPQGSTAQMGKLPPLPTAPPAPANLPGASPPPPPSKKLPPPPPSGVPAPSGSVSVTFAPKDPTLSPEGAAALHQVVISRSATGGIVVIGYGDAAGSDPGAQAAALPLAVSRVQAIVRALTAEGVPAGAIAMAAQAEGRGAALRLVNP